MRESKRNEGLEATEANASAATRCGVTFDPLDTGVRPSGYTVVFEIDDKDNACDCGGVEQ